MTSSITSVGAPKRRKAKVPVLTVEDSISLFKECIEVFGSECLRGSNFPPYMTIRASSFDPEDQRVALNIYVNLVNESGDADPSINKLREKLERHFGALTQPFWANLRGLTYHIIPKIYMH